VSTVPGLLKGRERGARDSCGQSLGRERRRGVKTLKGLFGKKRGKKGTVSPILETKSVGDSFKDRGRKGIRGPPCREMKRARISGRRKGEGKHETPISERRR